MSSWRWPSRSSKYADVHDNPHAKILAETLDRATGTFLNENKNPARRVGSIDNRGSHFYLALYWAQELAEQDDDPELAAAFAGLAETLAAHESTITEELIAVQGTPGRPRRLLPPRRRPGDRRDAALGDLQRRAGLSLSPALPSAAWRCDAARGILRHERAFPLR